MTSHRQDYSPTAWSAFSTSLVVLFLFSVCSYFSLLRSQAASTGPDPSVPANGPGEEQVANIPYFIESDEFHSTLILNNNQTEEKTATVTIFNHEGRRWQVPPIKLAPRLIERLQLRDLL